MTLCGAEKLVNGCRDPLVCNLALDHAPPHGVRLAQTLAPYVRWGEGVRWTAEDERRLQQRYATWTKPHVRRTYQTLAMWKAGR